jgi:hypothetical protein
MFFGNSCHIDSGNKGLTFPLFDLNNTFVSNIEKQMYFYKLPFSGVLCKRLLISRKCARLCVTYV